MAEVESKARAARAAAEEDTEEAKLGAAAWAAARVRLAEA